MLTLQIAVVVALAFSAAYFPVVTMLRNQWATNDTYSFGVFVPFISAYLIWTRRDRLRVLPVSPSLGAGQALVLTACAVLLLGRLISIVALQEISLILMLAGLVLLLLGRRFLRELWFPLAYLLLMLPMWEVFTDPMHHPSQLFSAGVAERMLHGLGVPVHRQGVYLHLPNITLEVASVCSGINFLIAVIAMGIPQAYLFLRGWLPRTTVILFAISIALLSNGLRVAIIGALSYYKLSPSVHGPGHILQGLFVSAFGFLALLGAVRILALRYGPVGPDSTGGTEKDAPTTDRRRVVLAGMAATASLLALAGFQPEYSVAAASREALRLPSLSTNWSEHPGTVTARFVSGDGDEGTSARVFEAPTGERIELFVGDLTKNAQDGSLRYRSVELPRGVSSSQVTLPLSDGATMRVNRAVVFQAGRETDVIYWYDLAGRSTAHGSIAKVYASTGLLFSWGATSSLVIVVVDRPLDGHNPELISRLVFDISRSLRDLNQTIS
jgi:exosortase